MINADILISQTLFFPMFLMARLSEDHGLTTTHSGGYDSFGFDITRDLRAGVNEVIVGVHDPTDGLAPVGKQRVAQGIPLCSGCAKAVVPTLLVD